MNRAAIYTRISTASKARHGETAVYEQNREVQEAQLRQLVAGRGWVPVQVYRDRARRGKEKRPGPEALMTDVRRGLIELVVVRQFDQFARSVKQLVLELEEFRSLGVEFVSDQEALEALRQIAGPRRRRAPKSVAARQAGTRKQRLSAEGRRRIAEDARRRWAANRAADGGEQAAPKTGGARKRTERKKAAAKKATI